MRHLVPAIALLLAACGAPVPERAPAPEPGPVLPDDFPHAMKGLSMYGYVQDGRTWFTLVTGTNRLKSFDELDGAEPLVGDDGWVRVRVEGVEAARDLLGRVPDHEEVMVTSIRHVSVAQNTVPDGIGEPDEAASAISTRLVSVLRRVGSIQFAGCGAICATGACAQSRPSDEPET